MRKIVGDANYKLMLDDLIDYSLTEKWNEESDYIINSIVKYNNIPYKANSAIVSDATAPDCSTKWDLADKFNDECYNTTWVDGMLREIIAWSIWARAIPFYPDLLDVGGYADKSDKDTPNRINYTRSNLFSNLSLMKTEFKYWNEQNGCMSLNACAIEPEQQQSHRKVGWQT